MVIPYPQREIMKYAKRSFWSSFNIFRVDFGHISSRHKNVLFQKYCCVFLMAFKEDVITQNVFPSTEGEPDIIVSIYNNLKH